MYAFSADIPSFFSREWAICLTLEGIFAMCVFVRKWKLKFLLMCENAYHWIKSTIFVYKWIIYDPNHQALHDQ